MIFDLWNTIAEWPEQVWAETQPEVAAQLGLSHEEFAARWYGDVSALRETGPIADVLALFEASPEAVEQIVALRRKVTRQGLVPVPGAVETIAALRKRGLKIGLITVCSEDVVALWPETDFQGLFDVEVFSAKVGLRKPDPRIYRLALDQLGVEPDEAVFVGDGANDELAGARRVGMQAVCVLPPGRDVPLWREARGWQPTITSLEDVLRLL